MAIEANRRLLRSGELAKRTGVSTDTLRHYERLRVLAKPARSAGGYRLYPPEAADRVRMVRRALGLGFTLRELAGILGVRDRGGAPCRQVLALAKKKLALLDARILDLTALRGQLEEIVERWGGQLERAGDGQRAGLLEGLLHMLSGEDKQK